jgi:sugar/nucleoside kinase (ribokinase family)
VLVCTLGDALLDVVVRLEDPIAEGTDTYVRTRLCPGGQAANAAAWIAALGARARLVTRLGSDPAGRLLRAALTGRGVEVVGPRSGDSTGTVVSLTRPDGTRTMLSDRGGATGLRPEQLRRSWLAGAAWLHVSGYALAADPSEAAALAAGRLARAQGTRVSLDLASTGAIGRAGAGAFRAACVELAPDLVFGTQDEHDAVGRLDAPTLVVKRGPDGCTVYVGSARSDHAAAPAPVVDATGAGDAFAAGFLVGGVELALEAAARCVATVGAAP